MREALEADAPDNFSGPLRRQERKDRLSDRGAVDGVAGADARNHADGAGGFNLVNVDNARRFKQGEVRCFLGFSNEAAQVRLGAIAEVVLLDGAIAKIEKAKAEAEFSVGRALDHAMALKNHEEAVRSAFVQLQRSGNLCQSERGFTFAEQVENGKGTIEGLDFVGALGSGVSHVDPLFRLLSPFKASQMMRRSSTGETATPPEVAEPKRR
jgi:hypothetical protein